MATANVSILPKVTHCLERFSEILTEVNLPPPLSIWQDELGRLRVWVANNNASQPTTSGHQSLDDRLQDASHIKNQVVRQLDRLSRALDDLQTPEEPGLEEISDSEVDFSDDDMESSTIRTYRNLVGSINSLYQMSLLIRDPAPCDRLVARTFTGENDNRDEVPIQFNAGEELVGRLRSKSYGRSRLVHNLYICCQCNDGPKLYNIQPWCTLCSHNACNYCIPVEI